MFALLHIHNSYTLNSIQIVTKRHPYDVVRNRRFRLQRHDESTGDVF
jgi:hypothetical protein